MINSSRQLIGEAFEMFVSFCEHERRAGCLDSFDHIFADTAIPRFVAYQIAVERMKLDALVRRRRHCRLKGCRTHQNAVGKRPSHGLGLRIDAMPNRTALHEDDRMMAILPRDRCRQSSDEPCFGPPDDLLKAMR